MKLGLTGRIACGKSTVSKMLCEEGFRIVDCDKIAHELLFEHEVKEEILSEFGDGVLCEEGEICRPKLGGVIFSDKTRKAKLENIMRPRIHIRVFDALMLDCPTVIDSFDLIGSPIQPLLYETWLVTCPSGQQLNRLMIRNNFQREQALQRIESQRAQEELILGADVIIDNSGTMDNTEYQVRKHLKRLRIH